MKNIKKFNEMNDSKLIGGFENLPDDESMRKTGKFSGSKDEITKNILSNYPDDKSPVKVKHLIEFLQQFDPETSVELDKDGWEHESNPLDTIENSGLFDKFEDTLFINN